MEDERWERTAWKYHRLPCTREELPKRLHKRVIPTRKRPQFVRPILRDPLFRLNTQRIRQPCIPLSHHTFRITFERDHLSWIRVGR